MLQVTLEAQRTGTCHYIILYHFDLMHKNLAVHDVNMYT